MPPAALVMSTARQPRAASTRTPNTTCATEYLVRVDSPLEAGELNRPQPAETEIAGVPGHVGLGKVWDLAVRDRGAFQQLVGKYPESGAENEAEPGLGFEVSPDDGQGSRGFELDGQ